MELGGGGGGGGYNYAVQGFAVTGIWRGGTTLCASLLEKENNMATFSVEDYD